MTDISERSIPPTSKNRTLRLSDLMVKAEDCYDPADYVLVHKERLDHLKRCEREHDEATHIFGDDEVLAYVTSGNAIPVTRCTVSADLIRQLLAKRGAPETLDDRLEHAKVVLDEVLAERGRQVYRLGWSPEHDDEHDEAELASAAACYALNAACLSHPMNGTSMDAETAKAHGWPWAEPYWKPKDARRDLIRAGALIIAELERLDRAAVKAGDNHADT